MTLLRRNPFAEFFFGGVTGFSSEHTFFGGATAGTLLAADFLDAGAFGGSALFSDGFNFVQEELASEKSVEALLAGFLTFDLNTAGSMKEHDAGGDFVDVLAAVTAGADEGFFDVRFADVEGGHPLGELRFFVG
jgi:hypothetical protein